MVQEHWPSKIRQYWQDSSTYWRWNMWDITAIPCNKRLGLDLLNVQCWENQSTKANHKEFRIDSFHLSEQLETRLQFQQKCWRMEKGLSKQSYTQDKMTRVMWIHETMMKLNHWNLRVFVSLACSASLRMSSSVFDSRFKIWRYKLA